MLTRYRDKGWMAEDRQGDWVQLADVRALVEQLQRTYMDGPDDYATPQSGYLRALAHLLAALKQETP